MKNLKLSKKIILTTSMALMALMSTGCEDGTINIEIDGTLPAELFPEKITEIVTVPVPVTEIVTVPIEITVPAEAPTEEPTEIATEEPTETPTMTPTDVPTEKATEATQSPTDTDTEPPKERDIPILPVYGMVIKDTKAIAFNNEWKYESVELYKGQKVQVLALYKDFYTISWYRNRTAQVPMRCLELFDEFYEPDFERGSWAGVIDDTPSSYPLYGKMNKDSKGILGNGSDIPLKKKYKLEVIARKSANQYIVTWFDTTMVVPSNDVDLFDPDYVPDYGKKSHWIGFLDPK